jgi:formyl-CoA transferase
MPQRHASGHPGFVPYQAFDTATGKVLLCVGNDRLFAKFAQLVGRPEWPADPHYATNRARLINQAPLLAAVAAILLTATRDDWLTRFAAAGVPCAPVNTIPEALAEPQVAALGLLQPIPGEDFRLTGLPLSFDGERPPLRNAGPGLGQHNAELLP